MKFYEENPEWVTPATRMREVVSWVENNLEDLSVSRPASRLQWGIPVPDDPSQTIYVWVDALVNYITYAGYPRWTPGSEHVGGWPADVHVIGKDKECINGGMTLRMDVVGMKWRAHRK